MLRAPASGAAGAIAAVVLLSGCGGSERASRPCLVPADEMADMLDIDAVVASPQSDGLQCVYAAEGSALVSLYVRTPAQFEAERARFEDNGVVLPKLAPVEGFEGRATIDPRYGSLNVTADDEVVTVELTRAGPAGGEAQLEVETEIARAALERL